MMVMGALVRDLSAAELARAAAAMEVLVPWVMKSPWQRVNSGLHTVEHPFQQAVYHTHLMVLAEMERGLHEGHTIPTIVSQAHHQLFAALEILGRSYVPRMLRHGWERGARQVSAEVERSYSFFRRNKLGASIAFDLNWPAISSYIAARPHKYAAETSQSTIHMFRNALDDGVSQGMGIEELARTVLDEQLVGISLNRARTIARTEVISATNRGAFESYRASGVVEKKGWLNAHDERVRPAAGSRGTANHHYDGVVELDQPFTLPSGAKLMHPGDTSLGAPLDEIINCRCAVRPVVGGLPGLSDSDANAE